MVAVLIRRVVPLAALACLCAFVVRLGSVPAARSDLWFHLRMGSEFLSGWSLSSPGHLGVYDTASWVPTQWLSQTGMAWAEDIGGLRLVLVISALLQAMILAVVYFTCRRDGSPLAATVSCTLCFTALAAAFTPRPQVASYLLFALSVAAWRSAGRSGRAPWWLVPVTWIWVFIHGMWPIAVALAVVMAAGLTIDRTVVGRQRLLAMAIPACSVLVAAFTPLGLAIFGAVTGVGNRRVYFAEWAPPDFTDLRASGVFIMVALVLVGSLRQGPLRWTPVLYLGLAITLAVFSFRTIPLAAMMLAPLVTQEVQRGLTENPLPGRIERVLVAAAVAVVGAAVAVTTPAHSSGPSVAPWLAQRIDDMPQGTRVLNDWDTGGYFLWRTPHLDLVMHGYADVFTIEELERNVDVTRVAAGWDNDVAALDADYALLDPGSALAYALTRHGGWSVLDKDSDHVLLASTPGS